MVAGFGSASRAMARVSTWRARLAVTICAAALTVCNDDRGERLDPVPECETHSECVDADPRFDRCGVVCEGHTTYCVASCETDDDCRGRGLPDDWEFCDIPRPGEGFCNPYNYDYADDACTQTPSILPD